jgi:hypothetical protein
VDVALVFEKCLVLCLHNIQVVLVALAYSENALEHLEETGTALGRPGAASGSRLCNVSSQRRVH